MKRICDEDRIFLKKSLLALLLSLPVIIGISVLALRDGAPWHYILFYIAIFIIFFGVFISIIGAVSALMSILYLFLKKKYFSYLEMSYDLEKCEETQNRDQQLYAEGMIGMLAILLYIASIVFIWYRVFIY